MNRTKWFAMIPLLLSAATAWAAQPQKCLDVCVGGLNYIHVSGWAYDPDIPSKSIDVHVYVYDSEGLYASPQVLAANAPRPDVNQAYGITGNHGFDAFIPITAIWDSRSFEVKVFAIDATGDGNPQIGSTRAVTVTTTSSINVGGTDYTLYTGFAATGGTAVDNDYTCEKMVDGILAVNPDPEGSFYAHNLQEAYVEFSSDVPIVPKGYVLNTYREGFYYPGTWSLKAKANAGDAWTEIAYAERNLSSGTEFSFACDKNGNPPVNGNPYKYFRFEMTRSMRTIWMSELRLYGYTQWTYAPLSIKAATCTETGISRACYRRDDGRYFTDQTGTVELNASDVIAPMIPHTGVCHAQTPNTMEHWQCSVCGKLFGDAGCTDEIATAAWERQSSLEVCAGGAGSIHVRGWAYDSDAPAQSCSVRVDVFGDAACTSQYGDGHLLRTHVSRPDVNQAYGIAGDHGFDANIPIADAGTYYVKVYAQELAGGYAQMNSPCTAAAVTGPVMLSGNYTAQDGDMVTGATSGTVTIADGASVILGGIDLHGSIVCAGSATITLVGTNNVTSRLYRPGIRVGGAGTTLTIRGDGALTATGFDSPGIGLDDAINVDQTGGDIVIEGGTITAMGGEGGPGIGTGWCCGTTAILGNITIKGGSVTAIGRVLIDGDSGQPMECPVYGIGTGFVEGGNHHATVGTLTVYDSINLVNASSISTAVTYMHGETDVTARAGDYFNITEAGDRRIIGPKDDTDYTITLADGIERGTLSGPATAKSSGWVTMTAMPDAGCRFIRMTVRDSHGNDVAVTGTSFVMPQGNVTVDAEFLWGTVVLTDYQYYRVRDGDVLIGSTSRGVTVADGASITLSDVAIGSGIVCEGSATITLVGTNTVHGVTFDYTLPDDPSLKAAIGTAGIQVGGAGTTLTIRGDGWLTAEGGDRSAGIGLSCAWEGTVTGGDIVIEGGNITARGGKCAYSDTNEMNPFTYLLMCYPGPAGIGKGFAFSIQAESTIGSITVKGGAVTPICGDNTNRDIEMDAAILTTGIDLVATTNIWPAITYMHGETDVTACAGDYFTFTEGAGGRTVITPRACTLADGADNAETISLNNGRVARVTLVGRTLYRDGGWNTLCLPFAVDGFAGTPLEGATVKTLGSVAFNGGMTTLNFMDATRIDAGRPYLVKWGGNLPNVTDPVFKGVTFSTALVPSRFGNVSFLGDTSPVSFDAGDRTALLIGADGALGIPETNTTVNSCRAWLRLNGVEAGDEVRYYSVNFGDGTMAGKFVDVCDHPGVKPVEMCPYCGERPPPQYLDPADAAEPVKTCADYAIYGDQTALTTGWHVVSEDVQIDTRVEVSGNVNLLLCDGAELTATKGFHVTGTNSLTVWAQSNDRATAGRLTVTTPDSCFAGIGGNDVQAGGIVTVNGGVVAINGGYKGSGIGGGRSGAGGTTTINGGFVTVTGAQYGTGIGGGMAINANYISGNAGTTSINGGEVTVTGGSWGAAIGCAGGSNSANGGNGGTVVINGGTVTATGGQYGAGIGGGRYAGGVAVEIRGGMVTAVGNGAQAIGEGSGWNGAAGSLTIDGMRVFASAAATTPVAAADRVDTCHSGWTKLDVCPHEFENGVCPWCGVSLSPYELWSAANGVSGAWNETDALGVANVFRYAFNKPTGVFTDPPLLSISFDDDGKAIITTPPLVNTAGYTFGILATDTLDGAGATTNSLDASGKTTIDETGKTSRFFRLCAEEE